MADRVQSILDAMVPPLRDLLDKGIFSEKEIHAIVSRRRTSEYLFYRQQPRPSDIQSYISSEIKLDRLRHIRSMNLLKRQRRQQKSKFRKPTKSIGDSHIKSHVHYIYHRVTRRFPEQIDYFFQHISYCQSSKSFTRLAKVYALATQRHPRVASLWIDAASFEFFGQGRGSIGSARVLLQRGLRVNENSRELWVQYVTLEMHYAMKLKGRKKVLLEEEEDGGEGGWDIARAVLKNGMMALANDVTFRLDILRVCDMFPETVEIERDVMSSLERDFGDDADAWIVRANYAFEAKKGQSTEERVTAVLAVIKAAMSKVTAVTSSSSDAIIGHCIDYLQSLSKDHPDTSPLLHKYLDKFFSSTKNNKSSSPDLTLRHARYLENKQDLTNARQCLQEAVKRHPSHVDLWLAYATIANQSSKGGKTPVSLLTKARNVIPAADEEGQCRITVALFHAHLLAKHQKKQFIKLKQDSKSSDDSDEEERQVTKRSQNKAIHQLFDEMLLHNYSSTSFQLSTISLNYLQYVMSTSPNDDDTALQNGRQVYEKVLFQTNPSSLRFDDDCHRWDAFISTVVALETNEGCCRATTKKKKTKGEMEMRLRRLFERVIALYGERTEGGERWRRCRDETVGLTYLHNGYQHQHNSLYAN